VGRIGARREPAQAAGGADRAPARSRQEHLRPADAGGRLEGVEERKLADLETQFTAVTAARPKILPHPAAIAKFVTELAETIECEDAGSAGEVLRQALEPFAMHPTAEGYRMSGALDVGLVRDERVAGA
jgi:hypothetical protein